MSFSFAELAKVMGVDDPNWLFTGTEPIRDGDKARFQELYNKLSFKPRDVASRIASELPQTYLPTILRAQVEAKAADPDAALHHMWTRIINQCYKAPAYERFLRQSTYASIRWSWMVKSAEMELPTTQAFRDAMIFLKNEGQNNDSPSDASRHRQHHRRRPPFHHLRLCLRSVPRGHDLPPFPRVRIARLAERLDALAWEFSVHIADPALLALDGFRVMGRETLKLDRLGLAKIVFVVNVLGRRFGLRDLQEVFKKRSGTGWTMCDLVAHQREHKGGYAEGEMRTCSRCKSGWYCSEAHQKLAWSMHRDQCFADKW